MPIPVLRDEASLTGDGLQAQNSDHSRQPKLAVGCAHMSRLKLNGQGASKWLRVLRDVDLFVTDLIYPCVSDFPLIDVWEDFPPLEGRKSV